MNCKANFNWATLDAYFIEVKDDEYYLITKKNKKVLHTVFVVFNN